MPCLYGGYARRGGPLLAELSHSSVRLSMSDYNPSLNNKLPFTMVCFTFA